MHGPHGDHAGTRRPRTGRLGGLGVILSCAPHHLVLVHLLLLLLLLLLLVLLHPHEVDLPLLLGYVVLLEGLDPPKLVVISGIDGHAPGAWARSRVHGGMHVHVSVGLSRHGLVLIYYLLQGLPHQ